METIRSLCEQVLYPTATQRPLADSTKMRFADRVVWSWEPAGDETLAESRILDEMLAAARRFVEDLISGAEPRWLTIVGSPGCGKTHLARCISKFVRAHGERIYEDTVRTKSDPTFANANTSWSYAQEGSCFVKWIEVLDAAREGNFGAMKRACRDWFKCVDDIGAEGMDVAGSPYTFSVNQIGKLCDLRLKKWTIFTSNYTRSQLGELFDPRIASRMIRDGSVIVDATGLRDFGLRLEAHRKRLAA